MKLLPLKEVKEQKSLQTQRELLRIQEMDKASGLARRNLATAEADFQQTLAKNLHQWEEEEKAHIARGEEMRAEIAVLEAQKSKALEPIESMKKTAEIAVLEAQKTLHRVQEKEERIDELSDLLQSKLDDVGARESDCLMREQRIRSEQQGIEDQQAMVRAGVVKLSEQTTSFLERAEEQEILLRERDTALILREQSLNAKEIRIQKTQTALKAWKMQLADERDTLAREFKRANIPT